jgi:predicted nuclease of restriction endonuclease-like (RecB) superfamily
MNYLCEKQKDIMSKTNKYNNDFYSRISEILKFARNKVVKTVNSTMVETYFEIGRLIVVEEQNGSERAEYGKQILIELSNKLTKEFGLGFSVTNLQQMKNFYTIYGKQQTLSAKSDIINIQPLNDFRLSWSHYLKLMRIEDVSERKFYEIESAKNNWSLRELQRQYDSALYTRLALSRDKEGILKLSEKGLVIEKPQDAIKDPYVLEFIGLPDKSDYSESDLEQKLIDKLEHFLLELGTGFTFVARQKRINFDEKNFRIDLVFYNRILKSFVLIDLKIGELKHQDIGQMQMYVNYYDREMRLADENKTVGLILCQDKSEAVVQYTLPENNEQIFASKYQTVLPSKERLIELIEKKDEN